MHEVVDLRVVESVACIFFLAETREFILKVVAFLNAIGVLLDGVRFDVLLPLGIVGEPDKLVEMACIPCFS